MKRILSFIIPLITVGCTQSYEDVDAISTSEEFYATIEVSSADTRTYVDENITTRWHADDRLTIFKKETYNREYKFKGKTGENSGGFTQVSVDDDFYSSETLDKNYAIYPHSNDNRFIKQTESFEITMPAEQTYAENTFGRGANTMVAVSETGQLLFKNVGSFLRVRLWGEDTAVSSITITSNGDEVIAGEATIKPTLGGDPTCVMTGSTKSITLNCPTPVTISKSESTPTDFWIVLPPVTFENGFTVTVKDSNDSEQTYDVDKSFTFARNTYYNLKREVTICEETTQPTEIPNNQIWYTSTDGQIVTPNKTDVFGANIVSNVYENGKGVITFERDITRIGDEAFYGCKGITSINIPNSVNSIGNSTFSATSLTNINIPDGVASIGEYAFYGCKYLTSITIPEGGNIGHSAFRSCTSLEAFYGKFASDDNRCLVIDGKLCSFAPAGLTSYTIPNGVTSIGGYAFGMCKSLTSLTIPDGVTSIEEWAFSNCTSLTSINIPDGVASVGNQAFANCPSLTNITIPSTLTLIGNGAFSNCKSFTSITIPESVTEIGVGAFSYCASLEAFYGKFASDDNRCLVIDGKLCSFAPAGLTSYIIPNGVISIGKSAFIKCSSLTSVTIPESVTEIGDSAFRYCNSLTSITIPDSVTLIGATAFSDCKLLENITIPGKVTLIDTWAFINCASLTTIYVKSLTPPTMSDSDTFSDCNSLSRIYVPSVSVDAYKTADGWKDYAEYIEGYEF